MGSCAMICTGQWPPCLHNVTGKIESFSMAFTVGHLYLTGIGGSFWNVWPCSRSVSASEDCPIFGGDRLMRVFKVVTVKI